MATGTMVNGMVPTSATNSDVTIPARPHLTTKSKLPKQTME